MVSTRADSQAVFVGKLAAAVRRWLSSPYAEGIRGRGHRQRPEAAPRSASSASTPCRLQLILLAVSLHRLYVLLYNHLVAVLLTTCLLLYVDTGGTQLNKTSIDIS
jgi:hypothetical protein